jgi:hypothetical protein
MLPHQLSRHIRCHVTLGLNWASDMSQLWIVTNVLDPWRFWEDIIWFNLWREIHDNSPDRHGYLSVMVFKQSMTKYYCHRYVVVTVFKQSMIKYRRYSSRFWSSIPDQNILAIWNGWPKSQIADILASYFWVGDHHSKWWITSLYIYNVFIYIYI